MGGVAGVWGGGGGVWGGRRREVEAYGGEGCGGGGYIDFPFPKKLIFGVLFARVKARGMWEICCVHRRRLWMARKTTLTV